MTTFADLHVPGKPFVLVNGWDVLTVLALDAAGHRAIGTTSLGITAAAGLPDGHSQGRQLTVRLLRQVAGRVGAFVTVDLEDGFSDDPDEVAALVADVHALGAAGVNLEDGHRTPARHAQIIAAVKRAVPSLFVNARTDVFWSGDHDIDAALERLRAYRDAGADGLFVPGLTDPHAIGRVVALGLPVNVLWSGGTDLAAAGVARLSTGSALYRRAIGAMLELAAQADGAHAKPGPDSVSPDSVNPDSVDYAWTQRLLAAPAGQDTGPGQATGSGPVA